MRCPSPLARLVLAFHLLAGGLWLLPASPASAESPIGALPSPEDFVTQQYEDFLGRSPDAAGLGYWAGLLRSGTAPGELVEAMAFSPEFEQSVAPLVRLYFAFFGRVPDYDGLRYWSTQIRQGTSLEQVAQQFTLSAEFQNAYGQLDDAAYIDLVYTNVMGRSADGEGRAYWINLMNGGLERGEVMVAFSDSAEYRDDVDSRVLATMLYVGMLRRAPDDAGLDYWAATLDAGTPYNDVIAGFLGAGEYHSRIGSIYDEVAPLTGVATRSVPGRPALAVKIDNVDAARPQTAVGHADLVYEEMVEGNLTRLLAVFHHDVPTSVGPVRSVRTTDFHLLDQLNTPLLAASGANPGVLSQLSGADVVDVTALAAGGSYWRDTSRNAPHNLFATTSALYAAAGSEGGAPSALFTYRPQGAPATAGQPATTTSSGHHVFIEFGLADIGFTWQQGRGWVREQNGSVHTMADGQPLAPANVVVLETSYQPSAVDAQSPEGDTVGTGQAWVFTDGRRVDGTWSRSNSEDPFDLRDGNGDPIALTPGQTFVELAPTGSVSVGS